MARVVVMTATGFAFGNEIPGVSVVVALVCRFVAMGLIEWCDTKHTHTHTHRYA